MIFEQYNGVVDNMHYYVSVLVGSSEILKHHDNTMACPSQGGHALKQGGQHFFTMSLQ